ncbi:MAG: VWA domain-containing protein [Anaerolineaceae bacterium]|jgi:uncharacterized protein with von Willebrand factor type A (vWA) domain
MEKRIAQFVAALRNRGVRVSLAETIDAFKAIDQLGVQDRIVFQTTLRTTLVKNKADIPAFDELFALFFKGLEPPPLDNPAEDLTQEEAAMIAQALRNFSERLRQMLEKLMNGERLSQEALEALDQQFNIDRVTDPRMQKWLANRMARAMQFPEVREAIDNLLQMLIQLGMDAQRVDELRQAMYANQQSLEDQLKQHIGQRIAQNISKQERQEKSDGLVNQPFDTLTENDMRILRQEVRRLAAALRTRLALRLKRARSGQLDVKSTLRANLKHGNVPVDLKLRDRMLKPKIVILCDLSTSMRHISELMLGFLYAVQDHISKTHAFAYIDHLEYISIYFQGKQPHEAIPEILKQMPSGHYNTDLGYSLENFMSAYLNLIDNRTTFIVVGDGRNNYNDPRLKLFEDIARRSRIAIWLNPEIMHDWGQGDSDMLKYAPLCGKVFQVNNLSQLSAAVDSLLIGGA